MMQGAFGYFYSIILVELENSDIHSDNGLREQCERSNVDEGYNSKLGTQDNLSWK
jgi:hypothetical protein